MSRARDLLAETVRAQEAASDPDVSAWVSANAGAGKTHVLMMRVMRLLLKGAQPERILCLTYTKAAAAEMSTRIFDELSKWATASDVDLGDLLAKVLGRMPVLDERTRARRLFAAAIETPGGLKVQTIHAFCERLLQRFPLEANVPPGFQILDDELARTLRNEAVEGMLLAATRSPDGQLGKALRTAVAYAVNDNLEDLLGNAAGKSQWLQQMHALAGRGAREDFSEAEHVYRGLLGLTSADEPSAIEERMAALISTTDLARLRDVLASGSANDLKASDRARAAHAASTPALKIEALRKLLLTDKGTPRDGVMTKKLATANPDLAAMTERAASQFLDLDGRSKALTVLKATMALIVLSSDVLQRFSGAKAQRAALDFDDLIERAARLLGDAEATSWVLFKLDGGLSHILVDEAQDTSPRQWSIIDALASEFFVGTGTADDTRTLFAVGDEKQSIYSFQGAAPKMFAATGDRFETACVAAGIVWRRIPLQLSFRTVVPLLDAVDRIFGHPARGRGVVWSGSTLRHVALRQGQAGLIEVWPVEQAADEEASDPWMPHGDRVGAAPAVRVADRIAATIDGWLTRGERLHSQNRPITPGDVLVLVRSRRPFAGAMVAALKARGIPVAGADRMRLTEQIAVEDLIALGDFLTLPEDDLALATVLKSPLFGLDDDDLLAIAPERKGTLWSAVIDRARRDGRFREAADTLRRWRSDADYLPPYEFFAKVLDNDGMRARLLRRLGPDAADPIDELLNRAINYDERSPPSMLGFLTWLRGGVHEIKRDMEQTRQEVRVMTVHGAKGLEAPIVFLPDTCGAPSKQAGAKLVAIGAGRTLPSGIAPPFVWPVKGGSTLEAVAEGQQLVKDAEADEHRRLLYVALTRPRDRLYIAGYEGKRRRPQGCWYDLVSEGLADVLTSATATDGGAVHRYDAPQTTDHEKQKAMHGAAAVATLPPEWARSHAPREVNLVMPLAPSRLAPLESDDAGEPVATDAAPAPASAADVATPSPLTLAGGDRFLRGTLTHALLQHLPTLPAAGRAKAAKAFLDVRARALRPATRNSIVDEALAVLMHPEFADVFGPGSQAEVPIVGEIANPAKSGPPLRIFGQIDRLVCRNGEVLIVDYKTNRPPPLEVAGIPVAYLYQMASYRLVLQHVYPGLPVRAAILWTDGARLMPVPDALLDEHASKLWSLPTLPKQQP